MGVSPETLALQNSAASAAIIEEFKDPRCFLQRYPHQLTWNQGSKPAPPLTGSMLNGGRVNTRKPLVGFLKRRDFSGSCVGGCQKPNGCTLGKQSAASKQPSLVPESRSVRRTGPNRPLPMAVFVCTPFSGWLKGKPTRSLCHFWGVHDLRHQEHCMEGGASWCK